MAGFESGIIGRVKDVMRNSLTGRVYGLIKAILVGSKKESVSGGFFTERRRKLPAWSFCFCLITLFCGMSMAGNSMEKPRFYYGIEAFGSTSSKGVMPFWLHSNRFGLVDHRSANGGLILYGQYHGPLWRNLELEAGADLLLRASQKDDLRFHQAWAGLRYKYWRLYLGRMTETFYGMVDPPLSSGTMDWSPNARPMNKIVLHTPDFAPLPFTRNLIYYDIYYAHGWFDGDRYVSNAMLHQKYLYLRMFRDGFYINPQGGIVHYVVWGGVSQNPDRGKEGKLPSGFGDYLRVVLNREGDADYGFLPRYRYGNSVGLYDFSGIFHIGPARISVYRQFYLEDTPNANFAAPLDGSWGFIYRNLKKPHRWFQALTYEHINTLDQLTNNPDREGRTANYYNHTIWRSGWTYRGRAIGNPLYITEDGYYGVVNNELIAHHVGIEGRLFFGGRSSRHKIGASPGINPSSSGVFNPSSTGGIYPSSSGRPNASSSGVLNPSSSGGFYPSSSGEYRNSIRGPVSRSRQIERSVDVRAMATYSRNYGAQDIVETSGIFYDRNFSRKDQWSFMLEFYTERWRWFPDDQKGSARFYSDGTPVRLDWMPTDLTLILALDTGELHPENFGVMISMSWRSSK